VPTLPPAAPRPQARLEDVARLAGVAKSTVSRVLIGEKTLSIRAETRERVLAAARTLDYRPDMRARSLRTRRSFLVGIVVPEADDPTFLAVLRGAQHAALERHYALLVTCADTPGGDPYRRLVNDNQVGGLLVSGGHDARTALLLKAMAVHHVWIEGAIGPGSHVVTIDADASIRLAVQHLAARGHRRIGFAIARAPQERFPRAPSPTGLPGAGLSIDPALVVACDADRTRAETPIHHLLTRAEGRPTALCTGNVAIAAAVIGVAGRLGLAVPDDLSVIALRDNPAADLLTPPVTAVRCPALELGRMAASDLIDLIEGTARPAGIRRLAPGGVNERGSVAAAP
jgi:DNA-binding LacI/PurR family transcriptional regulator